MVVSLNERVVVVVVGFAGRLRRVAVDVDVDPDEVDVEGAGWGESVGRGAVVGGESDAVLGGRVATSTSERPRSRRTRTPAVTTTATAATMNVRRRLGARRGVSSAGTTQPYAADGANRTATQAGPTIWADCA